MTQQEKTTRIQLRVTDETKQTWEDTADEEGFGSLAAMIRTAVNKQYFTSEYPEQGTPEAVNVDLSNIEQQLDSLSSKVNSIYRQMDDIKDDPEPTGLGDVLQEVEDDLMEILPTVTHPSEMPYRAELNYDQDRWDIAAEGGFIDDIILALPHGEYDIRATIDAMKANTPVTEILNENGAQVCWAVEFDSDFYEREQDVWDKWEGDDE